MIAFFIFLQPQTDFMCYHFFHLLAIGIWKKRKPRRQTNKSTGNNSCKAESQVGYFEVRHRRSLKFPLILFNKLGMSFVPLQ